MGERPIDPTDAKTLERAFDDGANFRCQDCWFDADAGVLAVSRAVVPEGYAVYDTSEFALISRRDLHQMQAQARTVYASNGNADWYEAGLRALSASLGRAVRDATPTESEDGDEQGTGPKAGPCRYVGAETQRRVR